MEENTQAIWLFAWAIDNAPWIYAGMAAGIIRSIVLFGRGDTPLRQIFSDSVQCFSIVSVASPLAAAVGFGETRAMGIGVFVGICGSDLVRDHIIQRVKAGMSAAFGKKPPPRDDHDDDGRN